ncbi:VOC family protein [Deinococcus roseus]|uniref:Lactoylglutathione lyase n=1 Tax=Deinococcus roseus TaxID=392414 RepID=A0ABQ2D4K5_9DEIO|nr:VOC family protein [Deinococcus roseus]GGJ45993.1 lactoylglutathione lyase [Deinococcus roseus]
MNILETCLYVHDLLEAENFYCGLLGFELHSRRLPRHVFLKAGNGMLLLFNPEESLRPGTLPTHGVRPGGHVCFEMAQERLDLWEARLELAGFPVTRYNWGGIKGDSLLFHDPSGNLVEMASRSLWGI